MPTCKKCSESFPNWATIDGVRKNLSARHYCLDCSPWGKNNSKRLNKYETVDGVEYKLCSVCTNLKPTSDYYLTRGLPMSACKVCQNKRTGDAARDVKLRAIAYKGGCCLDCKGVFDQCVYDFHHLDPSEKDFKISGQGVRHLDWNVVQQELDKCVLLCSNCHRLRHYDRCNPDYRSHQIPS